MEAIIVLNGKWCLYNKFDKYIVNNKRVNENMGA